MQVVEEKFAWAEVEVDKVCLLLLRLWQMKVFFVVGFVDKDWVVLGTSWLEIAGWDPT